MAGVIEIPDCTGTSFDHGAFERKTHRVFVAHTARDRVEVIDHDRGRRLTTLDGFREAAGVVADEGHVLVTNRRAAGLAGLDAHTPETLAVFDPRSGSGHMAIGEPRLIHSVNPRTGANMQFTTAAGAKTTAHVPPDHLPVFSSTSHGVPDLAGA